MERVPGLVPRYPLQKPPSRGLEGFGGEGGGWWGTFGSMRRGRFVHHKIHIKHQDLAQKDGRYNMVMLITREMDE